MMYDIWFTKMNHIHVLYWYIAICYDRRYDLLTNKYQKS